MFDAFFDRPVFSMYCKYAEYACKLQKQIFPWTIKQCHNLQKNIISYFKNVGCAGIRQKKHAHDQQKSKWPLKITEYAGKKCNIVICRSKNTSFTHISYVYMIVNVHICTICRAYIYIYICTMLFLEVTILFNQHFIIVENMVGKFRTGIPTPFLFSPEIP